MIRIYINAANHRGIIPVRRDHGKSMLGKEDDQEDVLCVRETGLDGCMKVIRSALLISVCTHDHNDMRSQAYLGMQSSARFGNASPRMLRLPIFA